MPKLRDIISQTKIKRNTKNIEDKNNKLYKFENTAIYNCYKYLMKNKLDGG